MLIYGIYINDKSSLVLMVAWHQIAANPLSEPVMTQFKDVCMQHKEIKLVNLSWPSDTIWQHMCQHWLR